MHYPFSNFPTQLIDLTKNNSPGNGDKQEATTTGFVNQEKLPCMGTNCNVGILILSTHGITPASKFNFEFNEDLKIYEVFECLERDKSSYIGVRADA